MQLRGFPAGRQGDLKDAEAVRLSLADVWSTAACHKYYTAAQSYGKAPGFDEMAKEWTRSVYQAIADAYARKCRFGSSEFSDNLKREASNACANLMWQLLLERNKSECAKLVHMHHPTQKQMHAGAIVVAVRGGRIFLKPYGIRLSVTL